MCAPSPRSGGERIQGEGLLFRREFLPVFTPAGRIPLPATRHCTGANGPPPSPLILSPLGRGEGADTEILSSNGTIFVGDFGQ